MEQYLWMAFGSAFFGFFVKTYFDVYMAYRAYMKTQAAQEELAGARAPQGDSPSLLDRLLAQGDRLLHAMLMSPVSR
jgi:hypothetical protein